MTSMTAVRGEAPARQRWWQDSASNVWPVAALGILLLAQFTMIFTRAINWDEYHFYNQVAEFDNGLLRLPLQTLHVRAFTWLPGLFETSTDHIVAARIVMWLCELVTLAMIYVIARRFVPQIPALFAPLIYFTSGYVLQHGMSFRVDPMLTAALMSALAVLARSKLDARSIALFGLLLGMAGMISMKAVLYAPCFIGLALMRWQEDGWSWARFGRLAACALFGIVVFAALYFFHSRDVAVDGEAPRMVGSASQWIFFWGLVPPYWAMAVKSALFAPLMYAAIVATPFFIWRGDRTLGEKLALAGLWAPILSVFFYTNTAGYFYVFGLAPLAVAAVDVLRWATNRFGPMLCSAALFSTAFGIWLLEDRSVIDRQRQLERNVHEIFAEPVGYFDHNSMLAGWPKANGFMTPWGMGKYREAGEPAYTQAMEERAVPLLLANWWTLRVMIDGSDDSLLLPADNEAMRDTYVEFSNYIYIAGKELPGSTGARNETFRVPGPYTLRDAPMMVNGQLLQPGEVVHLERGRHVLSVPGEEPARLIWGDNLREPSDPISVGPLYVGF